LNAPAFTKMIGDVQGLRLLDMACGEGYFSRFYAKAGAIVTGIDFSENQIAAAQAEESRTPLGIQYQLADASIMGNIESMSFDIVISELILDSKLRGSNNAGIPSAEARRPIRVYINPSMLRLV